MTTDTYRPQTFSEYIGQERAKRLLMLSVTAALIEGRMIPHVLLTGGPGLGKTSLAYIVARELGESFVATTLPFDAHQVRCLDGWSGVLFIDEVQSATKAEQDELLKLTEDGWLHSRKFKRTVKPEALTVIAATTEPGRLEDPFKQRFPLKIDLVEYTDEELVEQVHQKARMVGVPEPSDENALKIATAVAGSPREITNLMVNLKTYIVATRRQPTVEELFDFVLMDADGLRESHKEYLREIDKTSEGRLGLDGLRNAMGLASNREVYERERLLLRLGYIERQAGGRVITNAGHRRLKQ